MGFSNGKRLLLASRDIGDSKRIGAFEIRDDNNSMNIEQLNLQCFCGINGRTFASTVTDYSEDAIALFCDDTDYLLYPCPGTASKFKLCLCPCSRELLTEYTRQYPLMYPVKTSCKYAQNDLSAVHLDYAEGYLYMKATEYNGIELQLSDKLNDPLESSVSPREQGKHMEFLERVI